MWLFLSVSVTSYMQCDDGNIDVVIYKIVTPVICFLVDNSASGNNIVHQRRQNDNDTRK